MNDTELLRGMLQVSIAILPLVFGFSATNASAQAALPSAPFTALEIYHGNWAVRAVHPWSGAVAGATDLLKSRCSSFTLYFACEQTVNGTPQALIVYTVGEVPGRFNTRTIAPNGLAGGRGELTINDNHWTYLDKPPANLQGPWSRVENTIVDLNHIRFEEFESNDEGKSWRQTNSGTEERIRTS